MLCFFFKREYIFIYFYLKSEYIISITSISFVCSLRDVTITGDGLQILSYAWQSRPLSIEGSLASQTCSDTGYPFLIVISEDPWHAHLLPSVLQWRYHYLYLRLMVGIRIPNLPHANDLTDWAIAAVVIKKKAYLWNMIDKKRRSFFVEREMKF